MKTLIKQSKPKPNSTFSINSKIRAHIKSNKPQHALKQYSFMLSNALLPDNFTISSILKILTPTQNTHTEHLHAFVIKSGYFADLHVSTRLMETYLQNNDPQSACQVFDEMPEPDTVACSAVISGMNRIGRADKSIELFVWMLRRGKKPNSVTVTSTVSACVRAREYMLGKSVHGYCVKNEMNVDVVLLSSLVDMYVKFGDLRCARRVFDGMERRNVVSWNIIIYGHVLHGSFQTALSLFAEMIHTQQPRAAMFVTVLQACAGLQDLLRGREIHGVLIREYRVQADTLLQNALVNMYVKSAKLDYATCIFQRTQVKNVAMWTTMIMGYGMHGLCKQALETYRLMLLSGTMPDVITFMAVLSSCSHAGLVDEGLKHFSLMQKEHKIKPEMKHFAAVVDMYGRAGRIKEAYEFIREMPVEPGEIVWGALLGACRKYKNVELGEYAAKKVLELNDHNAGVYVLLLRVYADSGRWDDVARVRLAMKELGIKPNTACSWVEVRRRIYKFTVGDKSQPLTDTIYEFVDVLMRKMIAAGYSRDMSGDGHNVSEEEKMDALCGHTEKLALAFAVNTTTVASPIRIGKNLRVCRDCHEVFKYASKELEREIYLMDPNRYHHFKDGICSCRDYW